MRKSLLARIRWTRIGCILCTFLAAGAVGYGYYRDTMKTQLVEYRKTVEAGDTLWGIVGQVATNREDMSRLTWQVMHDNKITDPRELQPGQMIVIHVKPMKGGEEDESKY